MKTIGIIGAGNIGIAVAAHLLKNNISVFISNSKGPETLKETISKLGAGVKAVTTPEAAAADIVLLALPWSKVKNISTITDWKGKIVIDATNHFAANGQLEDTGGLTSSEVIQNLLPGARVIKAFNTLFATVLEGNPVVGNGRRVLFVSGNDPVAKGTVIELIKVIGFAPIDLGSLADGGKYQEAKGVFSGLNLIKV